ncbi:hypothetical protein E1B28_012944 [Marasmius oreades]|uniref:Uncharacterized protein n=1 Tax=Marasmius oreades TaxID=181124 RepID=A0A9P7UP86_9AGAR|nr:uncharacterized protein E1B28_012944 [Marasmius oreades]KAG7088998.1 hypothetical protein E1B28_012944 [Marasmius oreades]
MSTTSDEESLAPFLTVVRIAVAPMSTLLLTVFVYGIYVMVFGRCLQILLARRKEDRPNQILYLGWTTGLFLQATTMVAFEILTEVRQSILVFNALSTRNYDTFIQYLMHDTLKTVQDTIGDVLSVTINATAETMLEPSRFNVFHKSLTALIPGVGLASVFMGTYGEDPGDPHRDKIYSLGSEINDFGWTIPAAILNSILTLLTAGKIWWFTRQGRLLGTAVDRRYKTIVAVMVESGLMLPVVSIAYLAVAHAFNTELNNAMPVNLGPVRDLIAALAPTLIIVRTASNLSIENANQFISTLRFNNEIGQQGSRNISIVIPDIQYSVPGHDESAEESAVAHKVEISSV